MAHTSRRSDQGARARGVELRREGGAGGRDAYQRKEVVCAPLVPTRPSGDHRRRRLDAAEIASSCCYCGVCAWRRPEAMLVLVLVAVLGARERREGEVQ